MARHADTDDADVFSEWPSNHDDEDEKHTPFPSPVRATFALAGSLFAASLVLALIVSTYALYALGLVHGNQIQYPCSADRDVAPLCEFEDDTSCGWVERNAFELATTTQSLSNTSTSLASAFETCRSDVDWCRLDPACASDNHCACLTECVAFQSCWDMCTHDHTACPDFHHCPCLDDCLGPQARLPICTKQCASSSSAPQFLACLRMCVDRNTDTEPPSKPDKVVIDQTVARSVHAFYGAHAPKVKCDGRAWSDWPAWARDLWLVDRVARHALQTLLPYAWMRWLVLHDRVRVPGMTAHRARVIHALFLVFDPVVFGGFFAYQVMRHRATGTDQCCLCSAGADAIGMTAAETYYMQMGTLGVGYAVAFKTILVAWTIGSAYSIELGRHWFLKSTLVCAVFAIALNDEVVLGTAHAHLMLLFYGNVVMQSLFLSLIHPLFWIPFRATAMVSALNFPGAADDDNGVSAAWNESLERGATIDADEEQQYTSADQRSSELQDHWSYLAALPLLMTMQMSMGQKMELLSLLAAHRPSGSHIARSTLPCLSVAFGGFVAKTWQLGLAAAPPLHEVVWRAPHLLPHAIVRDAFGIKPIVHTKLFQNVLLATMVHDVAAVVHAGITLCLFNDRIGVHGPSNLFDKATHSTSASHLFAPVTSSAEATPPSPPVAPLLPWAMDVQDDGSAVAGLPVTLRVISVSVVQLMLELMATICVIFAHTVKGVPLALRWHHFKHYGYVILAVTTICLIGVRIERLWRQYLNNVYYCNPCSRMQPLPRLTFGASVEPPELLERGMRWFCTRD